MKGSMNIVKGYSERTNRAAVSNKKVDILLSPEKNIKKDFMHSRNSGLNQVMCKLAKKNNVAIGFNFQDVLNSKGKNRNDILGRMMLNVKLCRKYKVKMYIVNITKKWYEKRSEKELKEFGLFLGMQPGKVKVLQE